MLLLCNSPQLYALPQEEIVMEVADTAAKAIILPVDTLALKVRYPAAAKLETYKADENFQYERIEQEPINFWNKLWFRFLRFLRSFISLEKESTYSEYISYAIALGITIFVILKLLKIEFTGLFGKQASSYPVPYDTFQENIHEMNFEEMIEEAIQQKDYRRAVRLYYLQSLKVLTDNTLINWSPGKTNRSYLYEIQNLQVRREFEKVTSLFEYVWYGGSALPDTHFEDTRQTFSHFYNLVNRHTS